MACREEVGQKAGARLCWSLDAIRAKKLQVYSASDGEPLKGVNQGEQDVHIFVSLWKQ